jgi:hypothetical protein
MRKDKATPVGNPVFHAADVELDTALVPLRTALDAWDYQSAQQGMRERLEHAMLAAIERRAMAAIAAIAAD